MDSISRRDPCLAVRTRRRSALGAVVAVAALALSLITTSVGAASAAYRSPRTSKVTGHIYKPGFLACEVTNTAGINDRSFNESAWEGLQAANTADPSMKIENLQSASGSEYLTNITTFIGRKCGIIVTVGSQMATATKQAAASYPTQHFTIVDNAYAAAFKNVLALSYETNQAAFLGGYLAAAISKTGKVGTFGGENTPSVTSYMDGWVAGVRYYDQLNHKHVVALGWTPRRGRAKTSLAGSGLFTFSLTNRADGLTDALSEIQRGADVIFPVAGSVIGLGAAESVKENRGVTMEWADTDGCASYPSYCPLFITSVTKGVVSSVAHAVLVAASGRFTGGEYIGTLANNGVALSPYHDYGKVIPASVQKEIRTLRAEIIAGKISVDPNSYPAS